MNIPYLGEIAALFTSLCWALSALAYTISGRQIGSQVVNQIRVLLAFFALLIINWVLLGQPIPLHAGFMRWMWLLLSGVVGLAIADTFLFRTYLLLGPRLGLLLLSLAPIFSALIAWVVWRETLNLLQIAGIIITLAGIGWVVLQRRQVQMGDAPPELSKKGILFGIIAALGQAGGLILSRLGMEEDFSPFAGTLIRMIAGLVFLWGTAIFRKQAVHALKTTLQHPVALRWVIFGTFFGPVIGIAASLLALQHAKMGIASTIMALPPVFMLPISRYVFKERLGWKSIIGTVVAMAGIALLFV